MRVCCNSRLARLGLLLLLLTGTGQSLPAHAAKLIAEKLPKSAQPAGATAEQLVSSARQSGANLVLATTIALDKPGPFNMADPPTGTIQIERVFTGTLKPGALPVKWQPQFLMFAPPAPANEKDLPKIEKQQSELHKALAREPFPRPAIGVQQIICILKGREELPLVQYMVGQPSISAAVEQLLAKQKSQAPNEDAVAKRMVDSALLSKHPLVLARVEKLDRTFGFTKGSPPRGTIVISKIFLGKVGANTLDVEWQPPGPGAIQCPVGVSQRDREYMTAQWNREPMDAPEPGDELILAVNLEPYRGIESKPIPSVTGQNMTPALVQAVSNYVGKLRREKASHEEHWDNLDYVRLVTQATDVVVGKAINEYDLKIESRYKDSATPQGRALARPLYLKDARWNVQPPFDKGFIAFLEASPDAAGWSPPPDYDSLGTPTYKAPRETYDRLTFKYKPAFETDWIVPLNERRLNAINAAIRSGAGAQALRRADDRVDRVRDFVRLYYDPNARSYKEPEVAERNLDRMLSLSSEISGLDSSETWNVLHWQLDLYKRTQNAQKQVETEARIKEATELKQKKARYDFQNPPMWAYLWE